MRENNIVMYPSEEGGAYCFAHVSRYVRTPKTCATFNWRTPNSIDFKLCTLINANMKIIPIAQQVTGSRLERLVFSNISCLYIYEVYECFYRWTGDGHS